MREYLTMVEDKKIPANQKIIQNIQDIFNLSPDIDKYAQQFAVNTNDVMVTLYLASIVKTTLAVHDLIRNKNDYEYRLRHGSEEKKEVGHSTNVDDISEDLIEESSSAMEEE